MEYSDTRECINREVKALKACIIFIGVCVCLCIIVFLNSKFSVNYYPCKFLFLQMGEQFHKSECINHNENLE